MRAIIWIAVIMFTTSQVLSFPRIKDKFACPLLKCEVIAPECAEPTYFREKGSVCRGCDRDICEPPTFGT